MRFGIIWRYQYYTSLNFLFDHKLCCLLNTEKCAFVINITNIIKDFFRSFKAGEYVKYSVTASIGAAVFSENGKDFESLFKTADKAVYVVKKRGKNNVAFYDDVKEEAETQLLDYKGREE